MIILGIETSCDETAVAIVRGSGSDDVELIANQVASSMDIHVQYGGVVPEIAARSHIEVMLPVLSAALDEAAAVLGVATHTELWEQIDGISVVNGPGLSGSLLVGTLTARTLATVHNKPLYPVNHVLGHVYANFIAQARSGADSPADALRSKPIQFPLLAVIVSGGHTQLALFTDYFEYRLLGQTQDDAVGEAFDKVSKILGLPYPGGPSIAKAALLGDAHKYDFPKARMPGKYDFSFSGLKTAVLRRVQAECGKDFTFPSFELAALLSEQQVNDFAASFQRIAIETIVDKAVMAFEEFAPRELIIAGGVAASTELREQLRERIPLELEYAPIHLCTDNGAMIASLGYFVARSGAAPTDPAEVRIQPNLKM